MTEPLETLEAEILRKLAFLAEGRASDYSRPNLHRAAPSSTPPPGSNQANNGHLSPLVSLMEYHQAQFARCRERGVSVRLTAIAAANKDFETTKHRTPAYNSPDSEQNADERDQAILIRWAGYRPEWPAVFEDCSESYVRKLRRRTKRNPMTGELSEVG